MKNPIISGNTIVIPSSHDFLSDVDMFVEGILNGYRIDESIIADIAISVSELVNNAISHGNAMTRNKTVTVTVSKNGDDISITITDQGSGFDPGDIADPLAEENLLKDTGRGFFIVRSLMNDVDIRTTDEGTSITITKSVK